MERSHERIHELDTKGGFYTEDEMKDILKWKPSLSLN